MTRPTRSRGRTYNLSGIEARAILDLRLQRLTQIGVKEVTDELQDLAAKIRDYLDILRSRERIMAIISGELSEVRNQFAVPRRSEIVDWAGDVEDEDLIERGDMVVTVTQTGYIKRTPLADFRSQRRGGKASRACLPRTMMWSRPSSSPTRTQAFSSSRPTAWFTGSRPGGFRSEPGMRVVERWAM